MKESRDQQPDITLDTANAQPSSRFKALLAMRITYRFVMGRLFVPPHVYYMPLVALVLVVSSFVFGPDVYAFLRVQYIKTTTDTTSIYQQAVQKRPQSGERTTMATTDMTLESAPLIYPGRIQDDSNYFSYTTHITHGPQAATCQSYTYWDNNAIQSYTSATISFHTDEAYYSKSVTTDDNGNPIDYYLWTPEHAIEYKGGEYAIRNNYTFVPMVAETVPAPTIDDTALLREDTTDYDLSIQIDPQPEPELVAIEKIDGLEYYIYQTTYDLYCDEQNTQTGIQRSWINHTNQDVYKDQTYLNSVSANNLLIESVYINETKKTTLEEVAEQFAFEYNVPIRQAPEQDTSVQLESYLNQNVVETLLPTSTDWQLSSAYSEAANNLAYRTSYIFDRAYYAPGAIGEAMYQQLQHTLSDVPAAALELQFVDASGTFATVTTFDNSTDVHTILAHHALQDITPQSGHITINGQSQTVSVYEFPGVSVSPDRELQSEYMTLPYEGSPSPAIVFERNGYVFMLRVHDYGASEREWNEAFGSFDLISTANAQQRQQLLTRIQNTLQISREEVSSRN